MTKTETAHKSRKGQLGSRITGVLLAILVLVIFSIFVFFYFQKVSQREKLAGLLPADRTVALLEFNLEPGRQDAQQMVDLLMQNSAVAQTANILQGTVPFREVFDKWYSGRGGLAIMTTPNGQDLRPVLFLGVKNAESASEWINDLLLDPNGDALLDEDYYGQKLISFKKGQSLQILWTNNFLVLSEDKEILQIIAQTISGKMIALREMPIYNQLSSALPEQNLGYAYLDRARLLQTLSRNEQFLAGRLALFKLYFPLLNLIGAEGVSLRLATDAGGRPQLLFRHLALFRPSSMSDTTLFETAYFYSGKLEKFLPISADAAAAGSQSGTATVSGGPLFLAGGNNLLDQKNKLQSYLAGGSTMDQLFLAGLQGALRDSLGSPEKKLNLDSDLFPVFQKEYLFYMSPKGKGIPEFGLLIESLQPDNDLLKLKKIVLALGPKLAGQFLAKPIPMTLPDGTVGSEMKANLPSPAEKEIMISNSRVLQIEFAPEFSIYLLADEKNQLLAITNSLPAIKSILGKPASTEKQPVDYRLDKPTEIYSLDLETLLKLFPESDGLGPLKYLRVARKFTEIGILSTYQIGF